VSDFDSAWADFEKAVGPVLVEAMAAEAPRDTGFLADESQGWVDVEGELQIVSTDDRGPIARYMLRGTRPHDIYPVHASALHFFASDGTEVFTQHVSHPGTSPNPYNNRAWENVRDEVVGEFKERVGKRYVLSMLNPWRNRQL
jgi:hypothetical protein